jgi:hypothetical protein
MPRGAGVTYRPVGNSITSTSSSIKAMVAAKRSRRFRKAPFPRPLLLRFVEALLQYGGVENFTALWAGIFIPAPVSGFVPSRYVSPLAVNSGGKAA